MIRRPFLATACLAQTIRTIRGTFPALAEEFDEGIRILPRKINRAFNPPADRKRRRKARNAKRARQQEQQVDN